MNAAWLWFAVALAAIPLALYAGFTLRARRLIRRAGRAYQAERWDECLMAYRNYLLLAARTVTPETTGEILRYMAYAVGEADLAADLGGVKRAFKDLHTWAPARRTDPQAHRNYYEAYGRLLQTLRALEFTPREPHEHAPGCAHS